jgi:hypothetical protein
MKVIVENSESIKSFIWEDGLLIVEFKNLTNSRYSYRAVPIEIVEEFAKAESKGKYFAMHIKNKYVTEKLEETIVVPIENKAWPFPSYTKP